MTSGGPPKPTDLRREPGFDDDELPTDIIRRDPALTAKITKLRLGLPNAGPEGLPDLDPEPVGSIEPTVMLKKSSTGLATAALPRGLRAWLEPKAGPATDLGRIEVTMVKVVFGRGHHADVKLEDSAVSRNHAVVFFTGEEFRIRDEDSSNGTMLNGSKVVEYCIRDGDELGVGTSLFVFRVARV